MNEGIKIKFLPARHHLSFKASVGAVFVLLLLFISGSCFSQRTAGESAVVTGVRNVAMAAVPYVAEGYKRAENNSGAVRAIGNAIAEAKPMIDRAVPVVRKGIVVGKRILKILKKILR